MIEILSNTSSELLIVQGLGVIAFSLFALSFQWLNPRHTVLQQAVCNVIFIFHFIGLGQGFIPVLCGLAVVRDAGSAFLKRDHHRILMGLYLMSLYGAAFLFADQVFDWLAVVASTSVTVAQWFRERFYVFRFLNFVPEILWLVVLISVGSWPGVFFTTLFLVSNTIGIMRYAFKAKRSRLPSE